MERQGRIRIRTGEGRCVACEQPHTLDISYHCVGCDREVCALCIVTVRETREGYCAECRPDRRDRPDRPDRPDRRDRPDRPGSPTGGG